MTRYENAKQNGPWDQASLDYTYETIKFNRDMIKKGTIDKKIMMRALVDNIISFCVMHP